MRQHQRSSRFKVLSAAGLATLTSAVVIPTRSQLAEMVANAGESTPRKSINFGPNVRQSHHSVATSPSPELTSFNSLAPLSSRIQESCHTLSSAQSGNEAATCVGTALAQDFISSLHPGATFRQVDAYLTRHLNIVHAHFVQIIDGIPVANGNLNVNVDLSSYTILSYGDSSIANTEKSEGINKADWKDKVADWAGQASQIILDNSPQGSDGFAKSPLVRQLYERDPRHGLLTFLALQSASSDFTNYLLSSPRQEMISGFSSEQVSPGDFRIADVPTTVEPVKAALVYINDGAKLRLAWKYELRTDDNQYEAYMSADADTRGDEEPLQVIDWVRDYRPTGGEIGFGAMTLHAGSFSSHLKPMNRYKNLATRKDFRIGRASIDEWNNANLPLIGGEIDTTDAEAVTAFKAAKPAYKVFPWSINDPSEGKRELLTGSSIDLDKDASPVGWHTVPASSKKGKDRYFTDTRGNNVFAQDNPDGGNNYEHNFRPDAGKNMTFAYGLHWPKAGTFMDPHDYINASVTELFYTNNEIHDLWHRYGFDEQSGNFQEENFGRGGLGGDAVQANAQDGSGMNNANFATPPDGSRPRMRMYSWSGTKPYRDGDFEAGIVIHEAAHGLSTRLTGGPANSGCLFAGESGGAGEGWGDFLATMIRQHGLNETEFSMGEWASFRKGGIRNYPYSRNMTVNPSVYSTLDKPGYWGVHAIGEVWAEMLFTVAELLEDEYGFTSNLFPPPQNSSSYNDFYKDGKVPRKGNTLAIQLVIDGLKLQPCRPSFFAMRDAILTADKALTGGKNECIIWEGFSYRGLGPSASVIGSTPWGGGIRTNDFNLPARCFKRKPKVMHS